MRVLVLFLVVITAATVGSAAQAACSAAAVAVKVAVREAPLVIQRELSVVELQAMAAQTGRRAAHPVLGLYVGTVGYSVRNADIAASPPAPQSDTPCPGARIQADLVVVDRRIVVASDLSRTPCLLEAALNHYRRHAAAAHSALQQFASTLPRAIAPEVDRYVRGHPDISGNGGRDLRAQVDALLDRAVADFMASLAKVQAEVDSPEEVRKLATPCGTI